MDQEKRPKRLIRGVAIGGALLLLAGVLSLFTGEFIRQALLRPLLLFCQMIGIYLGTVPQFLIWFFSLLLLILIGARLLVRLGVEGPKRRRPLKEAPKWKPRPGPITHLASRIEQAPQGGYFNWRVRRDLQDFLIDLIAWRRGVSKEAARQLIHSGAWTGQPGVREFFQSGLQERYALWAQLRDLLRSPLRRRDKGFEQELHSVLNYLEAFARGRDGWNSAG